MCRNITPSLHPFWSLPTASFWTAEEVDLSKDLADWARLKVWFHPTPDCGLYCHCLTILSLSLSLSLRRRRDTLSSMCLPSLQPVMGLSMRIWWVTTTTLTMWTTPLSVSSHCAVQLLQVERFSAEVQVTEARCFYGFQITIEVHVYTCICTPTWLPDLKYI